MQQQEGDPVCQQNKCGARENTVLHCPRQLTTFGWVYNNALPPDDNYLDLALTISRNSKCEGGHMGCVFVQPDADTSQPGQLVSLSINSALYDPNSNKSDMHAEMNAICQAVKQGISLQGVTAYITMPPCKICFGLLQAAGITRIVHRRKQHHQDMDAAAQRLGVVMAGGRGDEADDASLQRVRQLWSSYLLNNPEFAKQELELSKEVQRQAKEVRKRQKLEKQQLKNQAGNSTATETETACEQQIQQTVSIGTDS